VTLRLSLGPVQHPMPALVGDSVAAATGALQDLNITVGSLIRVYSTSVAAGDVVRTEPPVGTEVDEGSSVTLYVSRGAKPVTIPDVRNESQAEATSKLQALGLKVHPVQQFSDSVPKGYAITTTPGPGTPAHAGDDVSLVVSQGPQLYPVPDVVGEALQPAIQQIVAAGFHADPHAFADGGPQQVLREYPTGMQPRGTTITLDYY
jgi:serine/threonine-protein kinase